MENKKKKSNVPFLLLDICISISAVLIFINGFLKGFGITGISFFNERINLFFEFLAVLVFLRIIFSFFEKAKTNFPSFFKNAKKADEYRPVYTGIFLVSASVLMLEILLTRIYSVTLFYHFAFMAISVAIFGGALSGVVVYLLPRLFNAAMARTHLSIAALFLAVTSVAGVIIQLHFKIAEKYSPLSARLLIISYLRSSLLFRRTCNHAWPHSFCGQGKQNLFL